MSSDFVAVAVRIFVNETVELATREFKFYNCAATVRKSENTPWVGRLICQFCSVTHWKYTVTVNTASTDNLDVNVSPCMNRWEIKALFVNCDAWQLWMHLLHFLSPVYYHAEEIASVSYSLIKKWKSISPFSSPLLIFFLHFFHAKERVMNELCLCEVAEIHLVVSNMDFHAGRSLMSLHLFSFSFFVCFYACSCIIMCVKVFFIMFGVYVSRFLCVCVSVSGACHVWPVRGAASGIHGTTPAATWTTWWATTSSSPVRLVLLTVNTLVACWGVFSLTACVDKSVAGVLKRHI